MVNAMRYDLQIIASWIAPESRVLGLACGDGELLLHLKTHKQAITAGIEMQESKVAVCLDKGLPVIQGDINEVIKNYPDNAFDYVILSQTLQQVYQPFELIQAMMRVGKKGVVSFPNFSHWRIRTQILLSGTAPITPQLPYEWYNTPNIRVITINNFRKFAQQSGVDILAETAINTDSKDRHGHIIKFLPNLCATYGIFLIGQKGAPERLPQKSSNEAP